MVMATGQKDLELMEAPGGFGLYAICPNCSKMYKSHKEVNPPGNQGGDKIKVTDTSIVPDKCERCGGPMDIDEQLPFANAEAERAKNAPTLTRADRARLAREDRAEDEAAAGVAVATPNADPVNLSAMPVESLRNLLRTYELPTEGYRRDLLNRIREHWNEQAEAEEAKGPSED